MHASAVALDKARHGGGTGRPEAANRLQTLSQGYRQGYAH